MNAETQTPPLRLIANRTNWDSWQYKEARLFANKGNGAAVRELARRVL